MSTQFSGDLSRRFAYEYLGEYWGRSTSDLAAIRGQDYWEDLTGYRPEHETVKEIFHLGLFALGAFAAIMYSQR